MTPVGSAEALAALLAKRCMDSWVELVRPGRACQDEARGAGCNM